MCKVVKKILSSPIKLLGGILAPSSIGGKSSSTDTTTDQTVDKTDANVQAAGDALRRRMGARRGFMASILTGGQGVTPTPSAVNTLLGGGG